MLNCIEIILLSQHCLSPFLSQSPTSIKLLAPCLLIFSFRNQEISESGGQAEVIPAEMWAQPGAGSTVRPQLHPKTTSASIQNSDFFNFTFWYCCCTKGVMQKLPRQEQKAGEEQGHLAGGRGCRAAFSNAGRKCFVQSLCNWKCRFRRTQRVHRCMSGWLKQKRTGRVGWQREVWLQY